MLTDTELMAQVLAVFREEQAEHCQAAVELLIELEREPDHPQRRALLDRLFREAHSLKGGARAAGQFEIEQIAHRIEDVFSTVRQGQRQITPDMCDPIYAALDAIGTLMDQVNAGRPTDITPYQPLLATLGKLLDDPAPQPLGATPSDVAALGTAKRASAAGKRPTTKPWPEQAGSRRTPNAERAADCQRWRATDDRPRTTDHGPRTTRRWQRRASARGEQFDRAAFDTGARHPLERSGRAGDLHGRRPTAGACRARSGRDPRALAADLASDRFQPA